MISLDDLEPSPEDLFSDEEKEEEKEEKESPEVIKAKLHKSLKELEDIRSEMKKTFTSTDTISNTITSVKSMLDALKKDVQFNENQKNLPFTNEFLEKAGIIGNKYELYLDGSTGWGIIFPNGYIEVEEGPHEDVGFMNGKINDVNVSAKSREVPRIPNKYWLGEMTETQLASFFDSVIRKYKNITG